MALTWVVGIHLARACDSALRVVLVQFVSLFINCILICFAIQGTCINSIGFVRDTLNFRPKAALAVCNSIGILAIVAVVRSIVAAHRMLSIADFKASALTGSSLADALYIRKFAVNIS